MFGEQNILLLLDIIDFIVDNGNDRVKDIVSSKEFLFCLLNLLKTKNYEQVQCTLLGLIKKWGENFAGNQQYTTFSDMYNHLKKNNVAFPEDYTSMYTKYVPSAYHPRPKQRQVYTSSSSSYNNNSNNNNYNRSSSSNNNVNYVNGGSSNAEFEFDYVENLKPSLNVNKYNKKYWKLVNYLISMTENVSLANEMIDNSTPNDIDESLREVVHSLHAGNNRLIQTIASDRLKDEKLMDITLNVSEDIRRTLLRWESLSRRTKVEPFLSTFMEKNLMSGGVLMKKKTINNNNNGNDGSVSRRDYKQEVQAIKADPNIKSADDLFDLFGNVEQSSNNINVNQQQQQQAFQQQSFFQQQQQPFQQMQQQQQPYQQQQQQQQPFQQMQQPFQQQQQKNPLNLFDVSSQPVVSNINPQQQFNSMGYQQQQQQQSGMSMQNKQPQQQSPIEDLKNKLNQLFTTTNNLNNNSQNLFAGYGQQQQQPSQSAFGLGLGQISQPLTLPDQLHQQQQNQFGMNQQQNPPFNMDLGFNNNNNGANQFNTTNNMNIMDYSQPTMNTMNIPLNQQQHHQQPQIMDNNLQFGMNQQQQQQQPSYSHLQDMNQQNSNNNGSMYPNFQSAQMGNIDEAKLKEIDGLF